MRHGFAGTGLAGVTVQLQDGDGNVLATTGTDGQGQYSFNQLNGVSGTGSYTVRVLPPRASPRPRWTAARS